MTARVHPAQRSVLVLGTALVLGACGSESTAPPAVDNTPVGPTSVSITAPSTTITVGATLQLTVAVAPSSAPQGVAWSTSDATRASVSGTGLVTALTPGAVRITATSTANASISASVDLTITGCVPLVQAAVANGATLPQNTCYQAEAPLTVNGGTLTIQPGVRIAFGPSASLTIASGGRMTAVGTAANPILLTSQEGSALWRGVRFNDSRSADNVLHYVTIERGGSAGWSGAVYSKAGLLLDGNSTVDIQHSIISGSGGQGITVTVDAEMTFENNVLRDNAVAAWVHPNTAGFISGNTQFVGNAANLVRVVFGNNDRVSTAQTWSALAVPYEVQDRMFIEAPLTVEAGTIIASRTDVSFIVRDGGSLTAVGTDASPITFTSVEDLKGYWKGLQITTAAVKNRFDHVIFENGGSANWTGLPDSRAMVYLDGNSKAVFTNTIFRGSGHYGLWVPADGDISGFSGNTFTQNARVMIVHPERAGDIAANTIIGENAENFVRVSFGNTDNVRTAQTWHDFNAPFYVTTRTFVQAPLTIAAGVDVMFAQNASFIVNQGGSLRADGTDQDRITFRGGEDLVGYWQGIEYGTASAANVLDHADFMNAGSTAWFGGSNSIATLDITANGVVRLEDVTFDRTGGYAVIVRNGGDLSCTNVDDGGYLYYVYSSGGGGSSAQCP
jgi:Bacterial Ig-like domain (group 2)